MIYRRRVSVGVCLSMLALVSCTTGAPPATQGNYVQQLAAERAEKDREFRTSPGKPVPADLVDKLVPLSYFPPDQDYVVPAALKPTPGQEPIDMPTSTGEVRKEERVGILEFSLKGQSMTLSAFHEVGSPDLSRLFVPFRDLTSGTETYQAGRYLDLDRTPTGLYNIDFNRAYNPYCYYNSSFDCPYPPRENRLQVPIRAGERLPAGTTH
jgi:uncharacterized protein (DUF1684 family)